MKNISFLFISVISIITLGCNNDNTNAKNNNNVCNIFPDDDSCKNKNNPLDGDRVNNGETGDRDAKGGETIKPVKKTEVSFFITSEGSVKINPESTRANFSGGNLGGIAGADAQCKRLAEAAGLMGRTWKAFLSTTSEDAFDRIGSGPWHNVDGDKIADNVAGLRAQNSTAEFLALLKDEKGNNLVKEEHDILIGDRTNNCQNWTSDEPTDTCEITGHASTAIDVNERKNEWILDNAHRGASPCSVNSINMNWGRGKFYCFASD